MPAGEKVIFSFICSAICKQFIHPGTDPGCCRILWPEHGRDQNVQGGLHKNQKSPGDEECFLEMHDRDTYMIEIHDGNQ